MIGIRMLFLVAGGLMAPSAVSAQQTVTYVSDTPARGWIGIAWRLDPSHVVRVGAPRTRAAHHPTVSRIDPGSPGATAGLRVGDAILSLNGADSRDAPLFAIDVPGTRYVLRIRRGDEEREVTLVVAPPQKVAPRTTPP
jgi:S1-C subfamily serine protease